MSKRFWSAAALWLPLVSTQVFSQPASWEELNAAGYEAYEQARYAEAEPLYQRALTIREKALGPSIPPPPRCFGTTPACSARCAARNGASLT